MTAQPYEIVGDGIGHVLVVDDIGANRLLLRDHIELQGHTVAEATNGAEALEAIRLDEPDVVLLDIQMPVMDGIEACRRIKANRETAAIPVLLVTALGGREHRIDGIRAGANDFVTKPVDATDLMLRVRNAIGMRRLFAHLEHQYETLRDLEVLRDGLVHMVIHDIRSPLTALLTNAQILRPTVGAVGEAADSLRDIEQLAKRISGMVSDMLDVSRLESDGMPIQPAPVDMRVIIDNAVRSVANDDVTVDIDCPPDLPSVLGDGETLERVAVNLIDNAAKYAPTGSSIRIQARIEDDHILVTIADDGPGIAPEQQARIFEKFAQVGDRLAGRRSSGLGLTFCKLAVEAHGGDIGVRSAAGQGCEFWFALPLETVTISG